MKSSENKKSNEISISEAEGIVGGGGREMLGANYRGVVGSTLSKPAQAKPVLIAARLCNLDPGSCVTNLPHHPASPGGSMVA